MPGFIIEVREKLGRYGDKEPYVDGEKIAWGLSDNLNEALQETIEAAKIKVGYAQTALGEAQETLKLRQEVLANLEATLAKLTPKRRGRKKGSKNKKSSKKGAK